jgi:hypothetical protein
MLLEGRLSSTGESVGVIGKRGFIEDKRSVSEQDRFEQVPFLQNNQFIVTPQVIYQFNFAGKTLDIKHQLAADERYVSPPQFGKQGVVVVTSKRTLFFDNRDFINSYDIVTPDYIAPHPAELENMRYASSYKVADGYMLLYFGDDFMGYDMPGAAVLLAQIGGETLSIGKRQFDVYPHPDWIRHFRYLISPTLYTAQSLLLHALEPQDLSFVSFERLQARQYPQSIHIIAVSLHLLSGLLIFALARLHKLTRIQTITWLIIGLSISLPALFSFILLNPWQVTRSLFTLNRHNGSAFAQPLTNSH